MATVLALETTSDLCSVALSWRCNILMESQIAPRRHNEFVLRIVDQLLRAAEIQRSELDLIAFSCGPGSFTGVRLCAAVAQGIAMGLQIRVIPIPTSDVMAYRVAVCFPELSEFSVRRRSHKGWEYLAKYRLESGLAVCIESDRLVEERNVPECAISSTDVLFGAEDVIEVARFRLDESVLPQLAVPRLVDGDSPYISRTGKTEAD